MFFGSTKFSISDTYSIIQGQNDGRLENWGYLLSYGSTTYRTEHKAFIEFGNKKVILIYKRLVFCFTKNVHLCITRVSRKSQNADAHFDTGGDKRREESLDKAQIMTYKLGRLPIYKSLPF